MEEVISENVTKNPIMSRSTTLYRILSLLLTINFYRQKWGKRKWIGLNQKLIQIYLWGLSGRDNAEKLAEKGRQGGFTDVPFAYGASVMQLLAYCHVNGFLEMDKVSSETVYDLTPKAYVLLTSLKDDELKKEIEQDLEHIGVITKESSKQLRIDWSNVTY